MGLKVITQAFHFLDKKEFATFSRKNIFCPPPLLGCELSFFFLSFFLFFFFFFYQCRTQHCNKSGPSGFMGYGDLWRFNLTVLIFL